MQSRHSCLFGKYYMRKGFRCYVESNPQEVESLISCFTNDEIEELAEGVILQFLGTQPEIPLCVDIDGFVVHYLKLPVEYHAFAEKDRRKIGFISDGITPLCLTAHGKPVKQVFPKGTVVLEKYLLNKSEDGRRRFTLAHEASHYIMDRTVSAASFHCECDNGRSYSQEEIKEILSFQEARVDRMAAALLMPGFIVRDLLGRFVGEKPVLIYGDHILKMEDKLLVQRMAETMGVSYTAFLIRLKELWLLERHDVSEYITQEIGLGGIPCRQAP